MYFLPLNVDNYAQEWEKWVKKSAHTSLFQQEVTCCHLPRGLFSYSVDQDIRLEIEISMTFHVDADKSLGSSQPIDVTTGNLHADSGS